MTQINPPHPVALRPGFAEALEARRLLAVSFDNALGILRITGDDANDIIQIQVTDVDNATNQPSSFTVFQSSSQAARPGTLPTQQQVIDYINSGGIAVPGQFQVSEVREMVIDSGNGDDLIILGRRLRIPARVDSGDGNDSVSGGLSDDTITGNQGTDYVFGGFGDDNLSGGTGSDEIFGGTGDDSVDYKLRTAALNITLDNAGGDAESGENDNVRSDIEIVIGGLGNDVISANASPSPVTLFGGAGDDSLTGSGFDDELFGDAGNDSISGGGGNDGLFDEDDESDTLDGGAGDDFAVANAHGDDHDETFTSIVIPAGTINGTALTEGEKPIHQEFLGVDLANPDEDDDPVDSILLQFDDSDRHIEVPRGDNVDSDGELRRGGTIQGEGTIMDADVVPAPILFGQNYTVSAIRTWTDDLKLIVWPTNLESSI